MVDTPEYKALTKCFPTLVNCVEQSPNTIATELKPSGILAPTVFHYMNNPMHNNNTKAHQLLSAVEAQIKMNPEVLNTFILALKAAGTWTSKAVKELEDALKPHEATDGAVDGLEAMRRQLKLTDAQLNQEIQDKELPSLASCVDSVHIYLNSLELTGGEQTDVKKTDALHGTVVAMIEALSKWKSHKPWGATYRALLNIMFSLGKETEAYKVMKYIAK